MTREEWLKRELAKAPERDNEWVAAMLRRFGLNPVRRSTTAPDPAVTAVEQDGADGLADDATQCPREE
ncbi:hypothetical protein [Streptomyces sp. KS 21]|uniref:hypothetical protein n=1 Tax=Streptomyces sp. KS 21 TaxID=2485150 RepID=UPI0010643F43|nr:hypothetical protein [Streptomyces sp. KS 21]TDU76230.1 hypothetical protein EDD91_2937 [Streptomyces sp. KS 21]